MIVLLLTLFFAKISRHAARSVSVKSMAYLIAMALLLKGEMERSIV